MFIVAPMGERIRLLRKQKGITQIQLSEKAGIGVASLIRYEKGERTPNLEILRKLADALEVDFAEFVGGQDFSEAPAAVNLPDEVKLPLLRSFARLNDDGRNKVIEYVEDITPKYKK